MTKILKRGYIMAIAHTMSMTANNASESPQALDTTCNAKCVRNNGYCKVHNNDRAAWKFIKSQHGKRK